MSAGSTPPVDAPAPRRRRWLRRLAIAAGFGVALVVVLRALLPTAIERGAAWAGPRYLGLPVRIANVDLALLQGRVAIEGLAIGDRPDAVLPAFAPPPPREATGAAGAAPRAETEAPPVAPRVHAGEGADAPLPAATEAASASPEPAAEGPAVQSAEPAPEARVLLGWDRVLVEFDWAALFSRTLRLRALEIDAPRVRVEREADGRIDPLAHARPSAPPGDPASGPEPAAAPEEPGEPWKIAVERLSLRDPEVRLVDGADGTVLVELGLEELGLDAVELRGSDLDLGGVGIAGPVLRVRRDFALAERAPPPAAPAPAAAPAPGAASTTAPAPARGYRVARVAVDRAQFVWVTDAGPLDVALAVDAEGVTAQEGERFPLRVALEIEGGRLEVDGRIGVLPPAFAGTVAWRDLPLPTLLRAVRPDLAPWLRAGRSTAALTVQASLAAEGGEPPGVRLSGDVALVELAASDPGSEEVAVGWRELAVAIREVHASLPQDGAPAGATRVDLARVRLVAPDVRYAPPTPALDALLGGGAASPAAQGGSVAPEPAAAPAGAAPTAEPAPAAALEFDVAAFELRDGRLRFEDGRGPGPLAASLDGLGVEAGALAVRTAGGAPRVALGSLSVTGQAIGFEDARGAAPRSGAVEGLALTLGAIEAAGGAAPAVAVATFVLDGQAVRFEDRTVEPPYRGRFRDVVARAEGLRFPERVARSLQATGTSADGGRFELVGQLEGQTGRATLTLSRLALAPFNPYATSTAGYRLGGAASLKTDFRMRGPRYDAKNRITLHELAVSSQDPGDFERRFGIPLGVALALLRDPGGDIALSVPVAVDEKGARTGLGTIVAGALRQALVGALSSPLKMLGAAGSGLGGLFGGGRGGLPAIASEPGARAPKDGQGERYEGLVRLLAERPQLVLRLHGRTGDADRPLLAQQILAERLAAGDGLPEIEDGAGFLARRRIARAIEARVAGAEAPLDPEDEALLARYLAAVEVPEGRLAALARARAEAVKAFAVSDFGIAADRLSIGDPAPPGDPGVLLELAAREG